jgi:hypothetical protein
MGRDGVTVDTLGFFGVPLDKPHAVIDFATGFGQALAVFLRQQLGERFLVCLDTIKPAAKDIAAFLGKLAGPLGKSCTRAVDGCVDGGGVALLNTADFAAIGWVVDDLTWADLQSLLFDSAQKLSAQVTLRE